MIVWGVKKRSADEIKRLIVSFRKNIADINKEPGAEGKYKEVQEAYETLVTTKNVQPMTNMVLLEPTVVLVVLVVFGGFDGAGGFGGFEDIFSSFFGGGGASRNPNAPRQG